MHLLFIIQGSLELILLLVELALIKQMQQFIIELKNPPVFLLQLIVILKQLEVINLIQLVPILLKLLELLHLLQLEPLLLQQLQQLPLPQLLLLLLQQLTLKSNYADELF